MNYTITKEELNRELKRYTSILDNYIIEYLKSLIELDFSVLREYISNKDKKLLTELNIYRKITNYNIINRTINILSNTNYPINISNQDEKLKINTTNKKETIPIFTYNYNQRTIDIYKTIRKPEIIEKELERIMEILEKLYDTKNPFLIKGNNTPIASSYWQYKHYENIKYYEDLFTKLDNYQKNEERTNYLVQISQYYNKLLLKEFDLSHKNFHDEHQTFNEKIGYLTHKRVKKLPEAKITNNINYV